MFWCLFDTACSSCWHHGAQCTRASGSVFIPLATQSPHALVPTQNIFSHVPFQDALSWLCEALGLMQFWVSCSELTIHCELNCSSSTVVMFAEHPGVPGEVV